MPAVHAIAGASGRIARVTKVNEYRRTQQQLEDWI
jgi:hypothetical protein